MKIYTKGGDGGLTSLLGAARVSKADARVHAYGDIDELNSCLGVVRSLVTDDDFVSVISKIQSNLFSIGALVADPTGTIDQRIDKTRVQASDVTYLEQQIDRLDEELPPLVQFVLPGGTPAGACLHFARSVCRRAERRVVALGQTETLPDVVVVYLNRLSDLLFTLARATNHRATVPETEW